MTGLNPMLTCATILLDGIILPMIACKIFTMISCGLRRVSTASRLVSNVSLLLLLQGRIRFPSFHTHTDRCLIWWSSHLDLIPVALVSVVSFHNSTPSLCITKYFPSHSILLRVVFSFVSHIRNYKVSHRTIKPRSYVTDN